MTMPDPTPDPAVLPDARARFWSKVNRGQPNECWLWSGTDGGQGYGTFAPCTGRTMGAHRFAYLDLVGSIPDGKQLDHLCRNRACVNPAHLEPVTSRENTLRGTGPTAINASKTHCPRGHAYSGQNVQIDTRGYRQCRTCRRENQQRRRAIHGYK